MATVIPPPLSNPALPGASGEARDPFMEGLPARFGKYTLIRKLATGGMAELFLAIQRSVAGFEKLLVIKRILPQMNNDQQFITMLLHEARVAATLSHPNIVQIFDVGQFDNNYYIAMEHVHGEDLRSIVRQMKKKGVTEFPLEHAIAIVQGMCAGLAYAHEKRDLDGTPLNIVHRDISPQNVVVTFTGDVKIVDFGIAKSDVNAAAETASGKLKGKIPYMSPEQAKGEMVDHRSDIFATGVMLFELTTGKRLFKGTSEFETLKLICERDYPWPSQVRKGYPQELEHIVMRALAKERGARFQSAREMQAMLEEFVRRERIPTSNIALSQFMQSLFEDKLQAQKEALLQGKQLADIIASQAPPPDPASTMELDLRQSGSLHSMPAASRTVTNVPAMAPKKSRTGLAMAGLGIGAVLAAAGALAGVMWWKQKQVAEEKPVSATLATAQPREVRGGIALVSDPPGASIFVDGQPRTELTPTTLQKIELGKPVEIKLTKDGYEDATQTVTLTDDQPSTAVSITLKKGTCSIEVAVHGATTPPTLLLDGKAYTGQLTIDGISAGDQHKLVVFAQGYGGQMIPFSANPFERKHFDVTLKKLDPNDKNKDKDPATAAADPTPAPSAAPAAAATGKLNVGAHGGWCNVSVDGAAHGPTPVAMTLPAGTHSVTCTTPTGKTFSGAVVVPADGTGRIGFSIPAQ